MESGGLENQINEFLQKFSKSSARAVEDDEFYFSGGGDDLIRTRNNFDMDYEGLEMTGNLISTYWRKK